MPDFDAIIQACSPYIQELRQSKRGCFLSRSVKNNSIDIASYELNVANRIPRDTPKEVHDLINDRFVKELGWPVRNGLFCYGICGNYSNLYHSTYGNTYLIFPCGEFQYAFDPNIYDLFEWYLEYGQMGGTLHNGFLHSINYQNYGLVEAMCLEVEEFRSVEIMINCSSYYLVNMKYVDQLIEIIWGRI